MSEWEYDEWGDSQQVYLDERANGQPDQQPRIFMDAYEFVEAEIAPPEILWGTPAATIIPQGGLCILAGRPGSGKTTFILDLACHLALGAPYPPVDPDNARAPHPYPVARPLRIAIIENEGPQEMFRLKLAEKLSATPRINCGGSIHVQVWNWGSFSFGDNQTVARSAQELDEHAIDLVIGDPLGTLGPEGVGSPQDTREFVAKLKPLGLGTHRAFLFLHHFRERVERNQDELARISGAWGGHLDTLLTLSNTRSHDQARLAWPKLRWARERTPNPILLGRIYKTFGFEALAEEGDASALEPLLAETLADSRSHKNGRQGEGWHTSTELAKTIEHRRVDVKRALEGAPHLFISLTGQEAKNLGAKTTAVLWGLTDWIGAPDDPQEPE